jgi:hypothetical protein
MSDDAIRQPDDPPTWWVADPDQITLATVQLDKENSTIRAILADGTEVHGIAVDLAASLGRCLLMAVAGYRIPSYTLQSNQHVSRKGSSS